jgi:CSLREA domain-containing protein
VRVGFCVIVLCLVIAAPARAAVIPVTTTDDVAGACSLREAIAAANTNTAQGACPAGEASMDAISLPPGAYELSIGELDVSGAGGALAVSSTSGPTVTSIAPDAISARLLDVASGESVTVTGVTFTGGRADAAGGAIRNAGVLTLIDSVVASSQAGAGAAGGGIFNSGTLSLLKTTVSDNVAGTGAPGTPGAPGGSGGGIASDGSLSVVSSRILRNTAGTGGAGDAGQPGGAGGSGGGVFVGSGGSATILDTLLVQNAAGAGGGGGAGASGGNGGGGGGLSAVGAADVRFSTLMTGGTGPGGPGSPPGIQGSNGLGTAIANAFSPASTVRSSVLSGSCMGGFTPASTANLGAATAGCPGSSAAPKLSAAGVPTAGSPAIDGAPVAGCPTTDLAGRARPQGVRCDIGAFEVAAGTLTYSRTSLVFPVVRVGSASTLAVTVGNSGLAGLALPVSIGGAGFRIAARTCAAELAGGRTCGVTVAFAPTAAAPFSGSLRLGSRTLPLSGTGAAAPIATPPKKCVVPKLKGKTVKQARRALKKRHCRLGKVTRRGRGRPGRIRASRPKAGSVRAAGTRVRVIVSRARAR